MSILIKVSNHLGLILPAPTDSPEQTARNRALSEIAFPDGNLPKYGTAMMQPQYCGKWSVRENFYGQNEFRVKTVHALGFKFSSLRMAQRQQQQGVNIHQVCEITGDARVSPSHSRIWFP
jgi:hypothetical protein